jgi:hypothetical protein
MTMATPGPTDVDEATIQLGDQLGSGGQGVVYRVLGNPDSLVFKQYKVPGADEIALRLLVDLPMQLQPSERDRLQEQTAWPLARVYDKGRLSGFLMYQIPKEFCAPNSAGTMKLRAAMYLVYPRNPLWGEIVPSDGVSIQVRIDVALEFARLMALLHTKALVIGDVSMNNVLWTSTGAPGTTIFLIDCDGIRKLGRRPVLPQAETPDWHDPNQPKSGPDLDTDRYKLALLVGRVLCCSAYLRPERDQLTLPELPDRMAVRIEGLWKQAAGPYGLRPDANQWMLALDNREEIILSPVPKLRTTPNVPRAALFSRPDGPRPNIRLSPPSPRQHGLPSTQSPAPRSNIPLPAPKSPGATAD